MYQLFFFFFHLGRALLALGRKQEAVLVLEQGYKSALQQTADVKQLIDLEELLKGARREIDGIIKHQVTESGQEITASPLGSCASDRLDEKYDKRDNHDTVFGTTDNACKVSSMAVSESGACSNGNSLESSRESGEKSKINNFSKDASKGSKQSGGSSDLCNGLSYKEKENGKAGGQINGSYQSCKPCNGSDLHNDLAEPSERLGDLSISGNKLSSKSGLTSKLSHKAEARCKVSDETKINKKYTIARISETHSISVDFRLSRGIAQVWQYTQKN